MIKLQKLLFRLLVFLAPTQLAYHFWPKWSHVWGIRVDYLSPTVYLTDIIIILLISVWFIDYTVRSKKLIKITKHLKPKLLLIISILLFVVLNVLFSNYSQASLYRWTKFLLVFLLGVYIAKNKYLKYENWFIKPLAVSIIFFVLIGLVQIILGHTIGSIMYLLGERTFSIATTGISTINVYNREVLRAYSTFSHPNSFAGYLAVSLMLLAFSVKHSDSKKLVYISIVACFVGLIATLSKGALIAVLFVPLVYYVCERTKISLKQFSFYLLLAIVVFSIAISAFSQNLLTKEITSTESVNKRLELNHIAGTLISEKPILGVGLNNFIYEIPGNSLKTSVFWWLQPVHNTSLLVFSEIGIVGLLLMTYLFIVVIKNSGKHDKAIIMSVLVILITGTLDHYWITLQQNLLLLTFIIGFSFRKESKL